MPSHCPTFSKSLGTCRQVRTPRMPVLLACLRRPPTQECRGAHCPPFSLLTATSSLRGSGCSRLLLHGQRMLTMASSASSSFMRLSLRSSWERRAAAWSVASLACRRSSHFSRSSRSFSLASALTASSLSCGGNERGGMGCKVAQGEGLIWVGRGLWGTPSKV